MAARARPRQAPAAKSGKAGDDVSRKLMVENIRDATGASEEEVLHMLIECNNDMNETTSRLIDSTSRPPPACPVPALGGASAGAAARRPVLPGPEQEGQEEKGGPGSPRR